MYYNRGCAYADKGNYDKAIADLTETIQMNPQLAEAYYNRGLAYSRKGEKTKAEEDSAHARKLGYKEE